MVQAGLHHGAVQIAQTAGGARMLASAILGKKPMLLEVHGRQAWCHTGGQPFDPARPVAVLVHGALNDHSVWLAQAQALTASGVAVLAPDLPGHGRSAGPALASVGALADWLLDLLGAAGAERVMLAGHSMGALIALQAAMRAPGRVSGLALLGATYPMRVSDALLASARDDEAAAIQLVATWSHAHAEANPATIGAARALMQHLAASAPTPGRLLYTDLNACNRWTDGEAAAASLSCPVLLVQGDKDKMTPPRSAARLTGMIQAATRATVVTVDAGHAMLAEAAEAASSALVDFALSHDLGLADLPLR